MTQVKLPLKEKTIGEIWIRQTSEPETFHYLIAEALSINPKPLNRKKMIIKNP